MDKDLKKRIIHVKGFDNSSQIRHGGIKRTEQLSQFFKNHSHSYEEFEKKPVINFLSTTLLAPLFFLKTSYFILKCFIFFGLSLHGSLKLMLIHPQFLKFIKIHFDKDTTLVIEGNSGVNLFLALYCSIKKIQFNFFPHNIEFVVKQKNKFYCKSYYLFEVEKRVFNSANKNYCISNLDCDIVKLFNPNNSKLLKFYPASKDLIKFKNIQKLRLKSTKDIVLLLGTIKNEPTKKGIENFLNNKDLVKSFSKIGKICVAGIGTENLICSDKINLLGSISDNNLFSKLVRTKFLIINQPPTSGFLTKIIEMNLCNIPQVITSNYSQAKNLENYGVFVINKPSDINKINLDWIYKNFEN